MRKRLHFEIGTAVLDLTGLRAGLYYYTHWVGAKKGQTGTVVKQP